MSKLYTKSDIKKWLKNLDFILDPPKGKRFDENFIRGNCPYDGITAGRMTAIMLTSAIEALPAELQRIVKLRWVLHYPLQDTLQRAQLTKDQYYYICEKAVEVITYYCNGQTEDFKLSLKRYLKKSA